MGYLNALEPLAIVTWFFFFSFVDLNIQSSGSGCVKVQNIECDNCKIETEQGTSILQSVKVYLFF